MWCPPPGQMMTEAPVSFSFAGRYNDTVGIDTFVSRMMGFPPGSFWSGFVVSCSGGSSFVSPGALPGQIGCTRTGFSSSAFSDGSGQNTVATARHASQPTDDIFRDGMLFPSGDAD